MFARFGREAREVIELAEAQARALGSPAVGPEHLLLALLALDRTGTFARAGLHFDVLWDLLEGGTAGEAAREPPPGHLPLRIREVLRSAFRHAASRGAPEVAILHLGLALVDDPVGEVSRALAGAGVPAAVVREALLDALEVGVEPEPDEGGIRRAREAGHGAGADGAGADGAASEVVEVRNLDVHRPVARSA